MKAQLEEQGLYIHDEEESDLRFRPIEKYCKRRGKQFHDVADDLMYMYHHPAGVYFYKSSITLQYTTFHRTGLKLTLGMEIAIIIIYDWLRKKKK